MTALFLHLGILNKPCFGPVLVRQCRVVAWKRASSVIQHLCFPQQRSYSLLTGAVFHRDGGEFFKS